MKEIYLTQGKTALVDDEDYKFLNKNKWCAHKGFNTFYAERRSKGKTIPMHRVILNTPAHLLTDHIDSRGELKWKGKNY